MMLDDIFSRVVASLISAVRLTPIITWYLGRKNRIIRVKTLLTQLQEELQANRQLPRQAKSRPYDKYLNLAIVDLDLSPGLRKKLLEIDQGILVIKSLNDRGITGLRTIETVFNNNLLPHIEQTLPLLTKEQVKWDEQRWWKKIQTRSCP
jgi:hypothetical protein